MCGISGIFGDIRQEEIKFCLEKMSRNMIHRGPDQDGFFVQNNLGFAHRRLSIIDLSDAGRQPMTDSSGRFTIVFNGEIYNFNELKNQLSDYSYISQSDTEVVLAAFVKWGKQMLSHLNGMFALAIWDNYSGELFLARDRMGIKPLYFFSENGIFIFASEIRAMLASDLIPRKINRNVLQNFLVRQTVHSPETAVLNIQMLGPGEWICVTENSSHREKWWELKPGLGFNSDNQPEVIKKNVRSLLSSAVERRMVSDVPVGAFLSGGIDSSAVAGLMATLSSKPVDTFSVIFNEKEFDESLWSGMVAKKFNTRHHPILVKPEIFLEELPAALSALDHPSADGINSFVVSKLTRQQGIKVALSGLGGDELFAGYPVFTALHSISKRQKLYSIPLFLRNAGKKLLNIYPGGRRGDAMGEVLCANGPQPEFIHPLFRRVYSHAQAALMFEDKVNVIDPVEEYWKSEGVNFKDLEFLSQISRAEIKTYTQDILLRDTDQMSMAHSLEVRVPFFDFTLVEYVLSISDSIKYPHFPKELLVESLGDLLPAQVVHRKKMGFTFPWKKWLLNDLKSFCETRIIRIETRGIFKEGMPITIWKRFLKSDLRVTWTHVWLLVVLDEWMEKNGIES